MEGYNGKIKNCLDELRQNPAFKRFEQTTDVFSDITLLEDLRRSLEKEGKRDLGEVIGWEVQAHQLMLRSSREEHKNVVGLSPMYEGTDKEGHTIVYPDLAKFSQKILDYFRVRLQSTPNPLLRARFADILWVKEKDYEAAQKGIEAYLESAQEFFEKEEYVQFTDYFGRSICIALQTNSVTWLQKLYEKSKFFLETLESKKEYRWVIEVLYLLLSIPPEKVDLDYDLVISIADRGYQWSCPEHPATDTFFVDFLKIKEAAYKKQGTSSKAKECRLAEARCYERLARDTMEANQFMKASNFLQICLQRYISLGGFSEKVSEIKTLLKESNENARKHEFQTVTTEVKIPKEEIKKLLNLLKKKNIDEILSFVASEKGFLCRVQDAQKQAEETIKSTPLQHLVNATIQDPRGNIIEILDTPAKKLKKDIYDILDIHYEFLAKYWLIPIFDLLKSKADKRESWGVFKDCFLYFFNRVKKYFAEQNLLSHKSNPKEQKKKPDIGLEVRTFFSRFDFFDEDTLLFLENGFNRYFVEDYVASIHILAFRIEAILRRVLYLLGVPTSSTRDGKTQEKNLERILEEEKLRSGLGEDVVTFLEWFLIDKLGFNLRHDVAHGLMKYKAFSQMLNVLLIYALLLFTRFSFKKGEQSI